MVDNQVSFPLWNQRPQNTLKNKSLKTKHRDATPYLTKSSSGIRLLTKQTHEYKEGYNN